MNAAAAGKAAPALERLRPGAYWTLTVPVIPNVQCVLQK
jgi:hypothetical protein